MSTILWLLAWGAYLSSGYYIGKRGAKIHRDKDAEDKLASLLFPAEHASGELGEHGLLAMMKEADFDDQRAAYLYSVLMALAWPLKVGWVLPPYVLQRLPAVGAYLKRKWLEAVENRRTAKFAERELKQRLEAVDTHYLPAKGDTPLELHEKRERLRTRRDNIDSAIDRIDGELDLHQAQLDTIAAEEPPRLKD